MSATLPTRVGELKRAVSREEMVDAMGRLEAALHGRALAVDCEDDDCDGHARLGRDALYALPSDDPRDTKAGGRCHECGAFVIVPHIALCRQTCVLEVRR